MKMGFEIQVKVEPFIGLDGLETELTDSLMAQLSESGEIPGDEELNQMTMETNVRALCRTGWKRRNTERRKP